MVIAEAAIATLEQAETLTDCRHVDDQRLAVFLINLGADRNFHNGIVAAPAGHHLAQAALAALRLHMLLEAIVDQGVEILHRHGHDIAAAPAVTTIGPAILDEFLMPERDAAVAASTGLGINLGDIQKAHLGLLS